MVSAMTGPGEWERWVVEVVVVRRTVGELVMDRRCVCQEDCRIELKLLQ